MSLVSYQHDESVATITMDDGKVNALSPAMQAEIGSALDQAEGDGAVVVLAGREGMFSAGFDLDVIRAGGPDAIGMIRGGFELAERVLSFPRPVVMACTGHAVAMGVFLLLSGDYRIGAAGSYKLVANEVAIGMQLPHTAIEVLRQRLTPAAFNRAVTLSEVFSPANAVETGFLDRVSDSPDVVGAAQEVAASFAGLDQAAHASSKLRARAGTLAAIRADIDRNFTQSTPPG